VERRWRWVATIGAVVAAASWPAAALGRAPAVITTTNSGVNLLETDETRQTCTNPRLVQAFGLLSDTRDYVRAPGGNFENRELDGWQVQRARLDKEGSTLEIAGEQEDKDDNRQSMTVPPSGSALSPAMCVDLHYPIFRFMAKPAKTTGRLKIEVVYPDSANPVFHTVGDLSANGGKRWSATGDIPLFPERGGSASGMRRVALRFTSVGDNGPASDWRIDDIYVDPRRL
jgi:hypothetical protein